MADKKISALTGATTPLAGTEVLPIVQSSSTVKVSVANLTAGRAVSALSFAGPLNGTVGATTPLAGAFTTLSATTGSFVNAGGGTIVTLGAGSAGEDSRLRLRAANTQTAWQIGSSQTISSALEITPSTAVGGTTFTTPVGVFSSTALTLGVAISLAGGTSGTGYSFSGSAPAGSLALDSNGKLDVVRSSTNTGLFSEPEIRAINTGAATLNQRVDLALRFQDGVYNGIGGISMVRESATNTLGSLVLCPIASGGNPLGAVVINSSGNLGLGVTPSAWNTLTALQVKTASFAEFSEAAYLSANAFYSSGWKYVSANYATQYIQTSGQHQWWRSTSLQVINTDPVFSQAMTLDASGNLLVGVATANANGGVLQLKSGITFPATAVAATDANTLDDYEEGTWTPNQGVGLTVVGTYTPSGTYTKIGRSVTVTGVIAASTTIAFSVNSQLCSNLPFQPSTAENAGILINDSRTASQAVSGIGSSSAVQSSATQTAISGVTFTITYNF